MTNAGADTYYCAQNGCNYDNYIGDAEYYDLALVQYTLFYRTGLTKYRDYARKIADSRWMSEYIDYGTVLVGPKYLSPRQQSYAGLMLRALDGRPEFWDYLFRTARAQFDNWVFIRRNDPQLYSDLRDAGYANLYAVILAKVLPDSYPLYANGAGAASTGTATDGMTKRNTLLADLEDVAINYFGRLQYPDGSWRWVGGSELVGVELPYMVGLYLEGAILLHQLSANTTVRTNLVNQIANAATHLYNDAYRLNETVSDLPGYRWRAFWYIDRGGTPSSPNLYDTGIGNVNPGGGDPSEFGIGVGARGKPDSTGGEVGRITQERNLQSMVTHVYGYLYSITGNSQYRAMGDELLFSAFGDDGVPPAPAVDLKQKIFSQNYRSLGRYLAWRLP